MVLVTILRVKTSFGRENQHEHEIAQDRIGSAEDFLLSAPALSQNKRARETVMMNSSSIVAHDKILRGWPAP